MCYWTRLPAFFLSHDCSRRDSLRDLLLLHRWRPHRYLKNHLRMPIDWSNNENNVRLLASTYAVLGKESVRKSPVENFMNSRRTQFAREKCYTDIARRFGNGATYDAIQKRFKTIAAQAERLQDQGHNGPLLTINQVSRPERSRKRPRCNDTVVLEPDDFEVIEQGRFRTPAHLLRNVSSRRAKATLSSPIMSPDIEIIELDTEAQLQFRSCSASTQPPEPTPSISSAVEPRSCSREADLRARKDPTIEERLSQSSQAHAEERAQYRRMYMEPPPTKKINKTSSLWQRSQPVASSSSSTWQWDKTHGIATTSYIDTTNNGCVLCKKRWSNLQSARQHELESELHQSNLRMPERVRSANLELFMIRSFPPTPSHLHISASERTTHFTDSQSSPDLNTSATTLPTLDTSAPSLSTRDSSVIVLDEVPHQFDKGKGRDQPPVTPALAPKLVNVGRDLRRWSFRHAKDLPKDTYDLFQEIASSMMESYTIREPSSSSWVPSTCEDPDDEDYVQS